MQRNPKAFIRIRGNGFDFRCYLGNAPATVTGGGAEYEAQKRPQSDAATLFNGNALLTMDVPVLFDGWPDINIQPHVDQIYALCRGVGRRPPPNFIASGPIPFSGTRFQMSLPEDTGGNYSSDGILVRKFMTLKLIEFNDPTSIEYRRRPRAGLKGATIGGQADSIVLKQPMNLLEVAAQQFGNASEATRLGRLNNITDVRKKLKAGQRIKLGHSPGEERKLLGGVADVNGQG